MIFHKILKGVIVLPPPLLTPDVPVLEDDEDILEAMVSLGDEIGLNVE